MTDSRIITYAKELENVWKRQQNNWKIIVWRQVFNRFFNEFTISYQNIFIRQLGASPVTLGLVNSFAPIMNTVISIPIGWLQDRYSLRKLFIMGVGLFTLAPIIFGLAPSWEWIPFAMMMAAFCQKEGSCMVICNISLENKDRLTAKSICEGIGRIPTLFAPIAAAIIISYYGGLTVDGIRPLYWIRAVVSLILFLFVATQLKEIVRPQLHWGEEEKKKYGFINSFRDLFKQNSILKIWIVYAITSSFFRVIMTSFRYVYLNEIKGADQFIIGGVATAAVLMQIICYTPIGRLSDKIGRKKVIYLLLPIVWVSNLIYILAPRPEFLLIAGLLTGIEAITFVVENAISAELVPPDYMGRWVGVTGLFVGLVDIPAPIIGGLIWEHIGPTYLFLIPILIDIFIKIPILRSMPETLHGKK